MNPKYPVYVISKGRWDSRLTVKALLNCGIPHHVVVEPQEFPQYSAVIDPATILVLPFSNLGQGSIRARNWVWEHAISDGHRRHWILDDNIRAFYRYIRHRCIPVSDSATFLEAEEFTDRYLNVALSGFQYGQWCHQKVPFLSNTRIYSCILIQNSLRFRWRGRYNEDTDLSLRVLKAGLCTVLFIAYVMDKKGTMTMKGGNTDELYKRDAAFDGRLEMARSLQQQHPDVVKITRKWGRWQHQVNYRPFKRNKLIRKPGLVIPEGINNYGMVLVDKRTGKPIDERARDTGLTPQLTP